MIWSIENEWLYINCINLHRKHMDEFEAEVKKVADAVAAVDPTRPTMNDGGGAHANPEKEKTSREQLAEHKDGDD